MQRIRSLGSGSCKPVYKCKIWCTFGRNGANRWRIQIANRWVILSLKSVRIYRGWWWWWCIADNDGSFCMVDYVYHTLAAKASGELCLKYIFSFGAFARKPLLQRFVHQTKFFSALQMEFLHNSNSMISLVCSASEWKVPTTFIYGMNDWMNYQGAVEARKSMKVPCEIIRVPQVSLWIDFFSHLGGRYREERRC